MKVYELFDCTSFFIPDLSSIGASIRSKKNGIKSLRAIRILRSQEFIDKKRQGKQNKGKR